MKVAKLLFVIVLLGIILSSPCAQAQKVSVMTGEWFPYVAKDLTNYGFAAEIVFYAFLASGIETEFVFASWDDAENQVKAGRVFATLPHKRTEAREALPFSRNRSPCPRMCFFI